MYYHVRNSYVNGGLPVLIPNMNLSLEFMDACSVGFAAESCTIHWQLQHLTGIVRPPLKEDFFSFMIIFKNINLSVNLNDYDYNGKAIFLIHNLVLQINLR